MIMIIMINMIMIINRNYLSIIIRIYLYWTNDIRNIYGRYRMLKHLVTILTRYLKAYIFDTSTTMFHDTIKDAEKITGDAGQSRS